jgi:uncharacterized protein
MRAGARVSDGALYRGEVVHQRLRPRRHRLRYRMFSLLLDLDQLPALDARLRLLSVNRANLFSFHEADHGDGSTPGLKAQVDAWLRAAGLPVGGRVRLLAMPRILGYAFNPLSVYFCDAPTGGLRAIVYEVNSTFGERHWYLVPVAPPTASRTSQGMLLHRCAKRMHVSPFVGMQADYGFRLRPPSADAARPLHIGVDVHEPQGVLLRTAFVARRHALTDAALLRAFVLHPLLTLKVIGAIHWEALCLWRKGVPLQPRPPRATDPLTIVIDP